PTPITDGANDYAINTISMLLQGQGPTMLTSHVYGNGKHQIVVQVNMALIDSNGVPLTQNKVEQYATTIMRTTKLIYADTGAEIHYEPGVDSVDEWFYSQTPNLFLTGAFNDDPYQRSFDAKEEELQDTSLATVDGSIRMEASTARDNGNIPAGPQYLAPYTVIGNQLTINYCVSTNNFRRQPLRVGAKATQADGTVVSCDANPGNPNRQIVTLNPI
uniref:hypothetical protein n=1 Tax=Serratia fonticola TaxID=47917 RepID=UPI00301CDCA3